MPERPEDDDPKPYASTAPEEVDAEIVEDGYRAPSGAASRRPEEDGAPAASPQPSPARRLNLSPGLMLFGALLVVALVGFGIWRVAGGGEKPTPDAPATARAPSSAAETTAAVKPPVPEARTPEGSATAQEPAASTATAPRGLPDAGVGKMSNAGASDAKAATAPGDVGDAIDLGGAAAPSDDAASVPEDAQPTTEVATTPETAAPALPDAASPAGAKIANELSDLKSALLDAQQESERNASEIAALRESLQQAIIDRDRRAGGEIADLRARLDKIEGEDSASGARQAAASLALVALQRALDAGTPYEAELNALARLAPNRPAIERLRARAATGAPTLLALKASFPASAREARALSKEAEAKGPFATFFARLERLISIRPAEPIAGAGTGAIISRAEHHLDENALQPAVAEIETLDVAAAAAFNPWLGDARARLAADQAIADLNAGLLSEFVN